MTPANVAAPMVIFRSWISETKKLISPLVFSLASVVRSLILPRVFLIFCSLLSRALSLSIPIL